MANPSVTESRIHRHGVFTLFAFLVGSTALRRTPSSWADVHTFLPFAILGYCGIWGLEYLFRVWVVPWVRANWYVSEDSQVEGPMSILIILLCFAAVVGMAVLLPLWVKYMEAGR